MTTVSACVSVVPPNSPVRPYPAVGAKVGDGTTVLPSVGRFVPVRLACSPHVGFTPLDLSTPNVCSIFTVASSLVGATCVAPKTESNTSDGPTFDPAASESPTPLLSTPVLALNESSVAASHFVAPRTLRLPLSGWLRDSRFVKRSALVGANDREASLFSLASGTWEWGHSPAVPAALSDWVNTGVGVGVGGGSGLL
jgi:hypothetical protein